MSNSLKQAAGRYIRAKIKRTRCMGKHMCQVCHRCKEYKGGSCVVYKEYVDAWTSLQASYKIAVAYEETL